MNRTAGVGLVASALIAITLAAACGGGTGTVTSVRTVPAVEPTRAVFTGDGAVDQVIAAALAADDIELAGLVGYAKVACKKDSPQGSGDPPACRASEPDGAEVEVLPVSNCDNAWVRPEQVPDAFAAALPPGKPALIAVARPKLLPTDFGGGFSADQVAVLRTGTHADGQAAGVALHVKNGRVVWIESDCTNLLTLIAAERVDSFIVGPSGVTPATPAAVR